MIPSLQSSQYSGALPLTSDVPELPRLQTTQIQHSAQSPAALRSSKEARLAAASPTPRSDESSLPQLLETVTVLVKDLLRMLQGLFTEASAQPREVANTTPIPMDRPTEEPPMIIPVATAATPPAANKAPTITSSTTKPAAEQSTPPTISSSNSNASSKKIGKTKTKKTSTRSSSRRNTMSGRGQFLWKPKSDKDGKLAVLLPKEYTGTVKSLHVLAPDGKVVLAEGKPAGVGNGNREHFRFDTSGGGFPDSCVVVVTLKDGSTRQVEIPNTSARFTR